MLLPHPWAGSHRSFRDDGLIRLSDQLVNDPWRRLAAPNVFLHRGARGLNERECGTLQLSGRCAAECNLRESRESSRESLSLVLHALLEGFRPFTVNKVMTVVEQQHPGIIEMAARPNRHVEGRA